MSHFFVVVLVPADTTAEAIEKKVAELMAPYSEEIQVAAYEEECWCISMTARLAARQTAADQAGTVDSWRDRYHALPEEGRPEWLEFSKPYHEAYEAALAAHPQNGKPDADCDDCKGSGRKKTTYNPKSKWDWHVIGGRWDGALFTEDEMPPLDDGQGGFNFGEEFHQISRNSRPAKELKEDFTCYGVVTPDGEWHEESKMGWWGISADDSDKRRQEWLGEMRQLLVSHNGAIAVGVDCHI